jgi:tetratricopeptide (TPR) repeat protein
MRRKRGRQPTRAVIPTLTPRAEARLDKSPKPLHRETYNGPASFTGNSFVTHCTKLLLVLLAGSLIGFGQQPPASSLESVLAAAQGAQAAGDYAAAANDLKQAVRLQPAMPQLWANLGLMEHEAGDISGAIASFQRAVRLDPSLYVPNLFLGIDYSHSGKAKEAVPYLIRAEKLNKSDPQAPLALGRTYFALGKFTAAAQELGRSTALDPKLGPAWFTLGVARLDEVEEEARIMSEEGKESPFSGALYADSLAKQARFGESASLYKTLLDSNPQPPCIRSKYGFALLRGHDEAGSVSAFAEERAAHPECGLAVLGQARVAIDDGNTDQAAALIRDLWERDHGFLAANLAVLLEGLPSEKAASIAASLAGNALLPSDLRSALATAFGLSGPANAASDIADNSALPQSGAFAGTHHSAAEEYAGGHFAQCERRLTSSPAPPNAEKLRLFAACSFFTGDNQRALQAASALRAMEPHSIEALYWSIQADERLAFEALARFQELEPDSARSHLLLGDIYHQLERDDDAQAEYVKALRLAPGDPAAMVGLATVYLNNKNTKGAIEIAQGALLRKPGDPELNLIIAEALIDERQYAEAQPYLTRSLSAKPQMLPRIHALMGKAYAEMGQTQQAIEQLKLGASSDVDGSVQYLLARLYRQVGDTKDANESLNRMKAIKQQREARGYKEVQDPDLSPLESSVDRVPPP